MTVGELIHELQQLDQGLEVVVGYPITDHDLTGETYESFHPARSVRVGEASLAWHEKKKQRIRAIVSYE